MSSHYFFAPFTLQFGTFSGPRRKRSQAHARATQISLLEGLANTGIKLLSTQRALSKNPSMPIVSHIRPEDVMPCKS